MKEKRGTIERMMPDGQTAIIKGMFKKETDPAIYTGLKVRGGCTLAHRVQPPDGRARADGRVC